METGWRDILSAVLAKSLRVAMDVRILQGEDARRGIGVVTQGFVQAILDRSSTLGLELILILDRERVDPDLRMGRAGGVERIDAPDEDRWWRLGGSRDLRSLERVVKESGARVFHEWSPLHGPFHWRAMGGARTVATLYDLIPMRHREEFLDRWPGRLRRRYLGRFRRLRNIAAGVAISECAAADFESAGAMEPQRIWVARPAVRRSLRDAWKRMESPAREDFILCLGSMNPSKNLDLLLQAYGRLSEGLRARHRLAIVGGGEVWERWLAQRSADLGIADSVDALGRVADSDLALLYRRCGLFVLPSRAEGFGLPALEAMASGAPLALSDLPVLREVAGDAAVYFPSDDAMAAASVLEAVLRRDEADREAAIRCGLERADLFSWERGAEDLAGLYHALSPAH